LANAKLSALSEATRQKAVKFKIFKFQTKKIIKFLGKIFLNQVYLAQMSQNVSKCHQKKLKKKLFSYFYNLATLKFFKIANFFLKGTPNF